MDSATENKNTQVTFDQLYQYFQFLIHNYEIGASKYTDFIPPLRLAQKFPNQLCARVGWHTPAGVYGSYFVNIRSEDSNNCTCQFNLKNKEDINKFLLMLKDQCYNNQLVGPNINGYSEGYVVKYMNQYGFGQTFKRLYPKYYDSDVKDWQSFSK
jgi:hypothetical protein